VRERIKVLGSLDTTYREAFQKAKDRGDEEEMARLDLEFQRDQIQLEVLLDIRDLLLSTEQPGLKERTSLIKEGSALIEKAGAIRRMTRLL
jgi:hypothetical protein